MKMRNRLKFLYCECLHYLKIFSQNIHMRISGETVNEEHPETQDQWDNGIRQAILLSKQILSIIF